MKQAFIMLLLLLIFSNTLFADQKIIIREYTYQASELDNKVTARNNALARLKELTIQEVASYIEADFNISYKEKVNKGKSDYTESSNQRIRTLTAGYIKVKIIEEFWNGEKFWLKAELTVDEQEIRNQLQDLIKKSLNSHVPDWFIKTPVIAGKIVGIGSSTTKEGALVSSLNNFAVKLQKLKDNLLKAYANPDSGVFGKRDYTDGIATETFKAAKSVATASFSPNIKVTCLNKLYEDLETSKFSTQHATKLEVTHNDKKRIVKLLETGDGKGKSLKTSQILIDQALVSFSEYLNELQDNGYQIKFEDHIKDEQQYWYAMIVK